LLLVREVADQRGTVRVFVPESALLRDHDKPNGSDMESVAAAIAAVTVAFREQVEAERARADRAEAARDALGERLDVIKDELRQAREAADQARQHAREAEDQIEALRRADDARRARGLAKAVSACGPGRPGRSPHGSHLKRCLSPVRGFCLMRRDRACLSGRAGSEEMQQAEWKSAAEIAEDIMNGEATYQLIVDLWSRMGELEDKVVELQASLQASRKSTAGRSAQVGPPRRWRSSY
jgi:hypothetical protein